MSSEPAIDLVIQKLAKSLFEGDRRKALSIIRSQLNKPFDNGYEQLVWKGWERAINRQEGNALICQMLNQLSPKDAKRAHQDLKKKRTEVLTRDHTQIDLSKHYISTWVSLLEIYCNLLQDKP
ncbi:MAG: hypothetical protein FK733_06480 [Asgard group archaeon]|nr:hypothetical protein [Asgard group archaeon]